MAELKYIPFYPGYMEDTSDLSDGEFRRLMYALCAYCEGAERPEPLTGKEVIAYRFITRNIKVSQEQYNAKCRKNSENAKKRTIANDSERNRSQANGSQTSQYKEQRTNNKEQITKNKILLLLRLPRKRAKACSSVSSVTSRTLAHFLVLHLIALWAIWNR